MNTRMLPWILLASACGSAPPPLPSPEAAPAPVAAPLPVRAASDAPFRTRLANGLTVLLWPPPLRDGTVALQLALAGGTSQGPQGLADLAAEVLLAAGDATAGRPGLRQSIAGLGGTIEVEHGPVTTWFGVRVPTTNLQPALAALTAALALPTTSRSQIERVRSELLQARALSVWNVPARAVPTRFLLGDRGSGEHLTSLMDRDPSEVVLYAGRHYRPEQAVLAIQAPLEPAALQPMVQDLGHWHAAAASADGSAATPARSLQSGVYWAPTPGTASCRALLVFGAPDPLLATAADLQALQNCVSLDGLGGRMERLQRDAGLADVVWQPEQVYCAEAAALVLGTTTTSDRIGPLWQLAQAARASLRTLPPTPSELTLALGRTRLSWWRAELGTLRALRVRTMRELRRVPADAVAERLRLLATRATVDAPVVDTFLELPMAMIVIGGEMPADAAAVQQFELLPPQALARLAGPGSPAALQAATPYLANAFAAVGGSERLRLLTGCRAACVTLTENAPAVEERLEWHHDGRLARSRKVLGATVETDLRPDHCSERVGQDEIKLTRPEAAVRLRQVERHPLLLLAAAARGELQFRTVAARRVHDRELMVLEAVGDRFERLRIHIDRESSLVRTVESWETDPSGPPTYLQETWSDYREVAGLRVPFRRLCDVDDGQSRLQTTWSEFVPLAPAGRPPAAPATSR